MWVSPAIVQSWMNERQIPGARETRLLKGVRCRLAGLREPNGSFQKKLPSTSMKPSALSWSAGDRHL